MHDSLRSWSQSTHRITAGECLCLLVVNHQLMHMNDHLRMITSCSVFLFKPILSGGYRQPTCWHNSAGCRERCSYVSRTKSPKSIWTPNVGHGLIGRNVRIMCATHYFYARVLRKDDAIDCSGNVCYILWNRNRPNTSEFYALIIVQQRNSTTLMRNFTSRHCSRISL